ncbi:MAG: sigma-70 family RNA polymerase sigma factor [Myxococcota bacterium]
MNALASRSGAHPLPVPSAPPADASPRSAGDPLPALAEIYHQHHTFVWRVLRRQGVPAALVDDAVHDVFLVVARRLHEFEGRAAIQTWLYAIARRVGSELHRRVRRDGDRKQALRRVSEGPGSEPGSEPHRRTEAVQTLRSLLEQLEEGRRWVFILSELEGMTAPEIATALGLKVPTVYSRLRLARRDLERLIAQGEPHDIAR